MGESSVERAALCAYAAGAAGILANLLLTSFFVPQFGRPARLS